MTLHWKCYCRKSPQFRLGSEIQLSSYVCGWGLCPCWAWKLWWDVLWQSL